MRIESGRNQTTGLAIALVATVFVSVVAPQGAAAAEGTSSGSHAERDEHPVIISEIASGWMDRPDAGFVELQNVSPDPVDLTGWNLYRCNEEGLRAKRGVSDADFSGVILQPGERYVLARAGERPGGAIADESLYVGYSPLGVGYVLEDPDELIADRVAVYPTTPWMTTSECDPQGSIPNILDIAAGESWQRFGATVTDDGRWSIAEATPDADNVLRSVATNRSTGVVIAEVAPFGPRGSGDDVIELHNDSDQSRSLAGWTLWRCTATGVRSSETQQLTFDTNTVLGPGERFVIVGPESELSDHDATMATSLADPSFGVQVRDATGALVDEVAVSHQRDSACQSGPDKLAAVLDAARGESYQRVDGGSEWVIAPRTPGDANARVADSLAAAQPVDVGVVVSELATDPLDVAAIREPNNFVELSNRSSQAVDVGGWSVWSCDIRGMRSRAPLMTFAPGERLSAGESVVIAAQGTAAAASAIASYDEPLHFLGAGAIVTTDDGAIADRVGAFHVNEMDESIEPPSPCTNGVSLVTFQPDRLLGESYQRVTRTGVDLVDFRTDVATPGQDAALATERAATRGGAWSPPLLEPTPFETIGPAPLVENDGGDDPSTGGDEPTSLSPARVVVGTTDAALARGWSLAGETVVSQATAPRPATTVARGWEYPAMRLEYAEAVSGTVSWSGTVSARHRVVLSHWSSDGEWLVIGEAIASPTGDVTVTGTVTGSDEGPGPGEGTGGGDSAAPTPAGAAAALLVQVLPAPRIDEQRAPDGAFELPEAIDATIVHVTDTQYLSEGYPDEYERMTTWITDLAQRRDVVAAVHTGDLVQSWVDPDQDVARARIEFDRASRAQSILEDAGVVSTVLPGNHDTKRGITTELYNEYFGPDRYVDAPGFVASITEDDATSSYTIVDAGGAPMLILSIGYGYGERELEWAEGVVASHPDHNIVIATHEHLTPLTLEDPSRRATSNRWLSRADELWQRVIAPNRHVVAVLAGHYHGLGAIVTPDAGGIDGHHVVELLADYQEFRTDTGERATGFVRLLQLDLAAGVLAVDTYSPRLDARVSAPFDAVQFRLENGDPNNAANGRPWNIIEIDREDRYGIDDDEFVVALPLQYAKPMTMTTLTISSATTDDTLARGTSALLVTSPSAAV